MAETNKIAFILCVNNIMEFEECRYYLGRLTIPEGYEAEMITITDAASMAAGYNQAMKSSQAKYKVYMHQDVFIKNTEFVQDMLHIFQSDEKIGALGMIGRKFLPERMLVAADWDAGNILHNCAGGIMDFSDTTEEIQQVDAVDGLLLATQYDVEWREDIFDGWDFYDISQCMEMQRLGYKVVVPRQDEAWCYHDNTYSRLKNYFKYQSRFAKEYTDIKAFSCPKEAGGATEREELLEALKTNLVSLIEQGEKKAVADIFLEIGNTCYLSLRELSAISQIDRLETANQIEELFWKNGMTALELLEAVSKLKHQIKRIEYDIDCVEETIEGICRQNSVFAIAVIINFYVGYKDMVVDKIQDWYHRKNMEWEELVLKEIRKQFSYSLKKKV